MYASVMVWKFLLAVFTLPMHSLVFVANDKSWIIGPEVLLFSCKPILYTNCISSLTGSASSTVMSKVVFSNEGLY